MGGMFLLLSFGSTCRLTCAVFRVPSVRCGKCKMRSEQGHFSCYEVLGVVGGKAYGRWGAARKSKRAPHMHVLVCICNNVRQFSQLCPAQLSFRLIVL